MFPNSVKIKYKGQEKLYLPRVAPNLGEYRILGDEELESSNYSSRTNPDNGWPDNRFPCTPSVTRFYPIPKVGAGDFRTDISPLLDEFLALNGETSIEDRKAHYFFLPTTAMFNTTGYPRQAYITMQRNILRGRLINGWLEFVTLSPRSVVQGLTHVTSPYLIHRFDLVCWTKDKTTIHKDTTPQGIIDYFLCTDEGIAYIQEKYIRRL